MLNIKFIRENPEQVKKAVDEKLEPVDVDYILEIDEEVRKLKSDLQKLNTQRNANAKLIPQASAEERPELIRRGKEIGKKIEALKPSLNESELQLNRLLSITPAIPHPSAPRGKSEEDNVEIKKHGEKPHFTFTPKNHIESFGAKQLGRI